LNTARRLRVNETWAFVLTLRRQQGNIAVTTAKSDRDSGFDLTPLSEFPADSVVGWLIAES